MITYYLKICYSLFMIDLHTHSTASDGNLSPTNLVLKAKERGITVLALTDHDTTAGLAEAASAALSQGITFVPGIELNITWPTGEFHLLGLGLTHTHQELQSIITELKDQRTNRNKNIIQKLKQDGFPVSQELLQAEFPNSTLGRPHIAAYLVKIGACKTVQQAFDQYLGKGRPYYIHRAGADLQDSIHAIKASGGIPVLAHPLSLYVSWGKIEPVLRGLRDAGVEGLEAYHPGARRPEGFRLEEMGRRLGFFITGGSDFHGEGIRKDRKLGHGCKGDKIPRRLWTEELLPRLTFTERLQECDAGGAMEPVFKIWKSNTTD